MGNPGMGVLDQFDRLHAASFTPGMTCCILVLAVHSLGLELVGPSCRPHDVLSVGDDDIDTMVGVLGSDVIVAELVVLRLGNSLVGTVSGSLMGGTIDSSLPLGVV